MEDGQTTITILMADNHEDDKILIHQALVESRLPIDLYIVSNGEDLLDYLYNRGQYIDKTIAPRPKLILLDLNMPRKTGLEVLRDIKTDPFLRHIPVIILTKSGTEEDIYHTYNLGANSFIIKPVKFASLVEVMKNLGKYWFEIVELPLEIMGGVNEQKSHQSFVS